MRSYASAYAASLAHGIAAIDVSFGPTTALIVVDQANQSSPQFRARWVALDEDSVLSRPILPLAELDGVRRGERFSREIKGERGQPGSLVTYVPLDRSASRPGRSAVEVVESLKYTSWFEHGNLDLRRILVAEDDPQMLRLVADTLRAGYEVVEAHSGSDLVEHLSDCLLQTQRRERFDLVISDHRMPGFTGLEVVEGLLAVDSAPPFVMITAFGGAEFAEEAWRAGARAVLDKPFQTRGLLDVVVELIDPALS